MTIAAETLVRPGHHVQVTALLLVQDHAHGPRGGTAGRSVAYAATIGADGPEHTLERMEDGVLDLGVGALLYTGVSDRNAYSLASLRGSSWRLNLINCKVN